MSSARVESPLFQDLRRQPSPPRSSTMPKSRACRRLFPVDHAETNRFLHAETARLDMEDREKMREYGFDFDRYEPLPDQTHSRFTDWEAIPAERAPSFYHETAVTSKPSSRRCSRPAPPTPTSLSSQSNLKNGQPHRPRFPSSTTVSEIPSQTESAVETGSALSDSPVHPEDIQSTANLTSVACHRPKETNEPVLLSESSTSAASRPTRQSPETLDNIQNVARPTSASTSSTTCDSVTSCPESATTQSKITDFMRQRKRNKSDSNRASSASSSDGEGGKQHQVPVKRRRARSFDSSSATGQS